jgi:hypothetical protein
MTGLQAERRGDRRKACAAGAGSEFELTQFGVDGTVGASVIAFLWRP